MRQTQHGLLLVVCDGMGGHAGGERASRLATEVFVRSVENGSGTVRQILEHALFEANRAVVAESISSSELAGMGTTLVAALLQGRVATIINLGDSRAYLYRGGAVSRITSDHSFVGEMVARGELTEEEAAIHPRRNIITRAIGIEGDPQPDLYEIELSEGDMLLLASDGLHGMISDMLISSTLSESDQPDRLCDLLIERALDGGGRDNVTVVLARAGGSDPDEGPPTDPGEIRRRKGRTGSVRNIFISLLFTVAALAAAWFFWLGPMLRNQVDGTAIDSARMIQNDSALLADSVPPFLDSIPMLNGADDSVFIGDTLDW